MMKQAVWKPEGAGLRRRAMGSRDGQVMKTRCQHRHRMRLEAEVPVTGQEGWLS